MGKIRIIAVGKVKEQNLRAGIEEYTKRLVPYAKVEFVELKDESLITEAEKLDKYLSPSAYLLDAAGKEYASEEFAALIKRQQLGDITFIIGGAQGTLPQFKAKAKMRANLLSLSKMTFPHELARLMLLEQIYRACMINANRPYHK